MKKVGLALGGGGARGVAHIAYLQALDEMGVRPSVIAGTSSGAMFGSLYAAGVKPDEMYDILKGIFNIKSKGKNKGSNQLKDIKNVPGKLIASMARKYYSRYLPCSAFEELETPLKIVATDFNTLEEKVFDSGSIADAVMCSIAFPGVFNPQKAGGRHYIDGGATNIVPFDIIRSECDVLIAIDVSKVRPNSYKPTRKNSLEANWAATQQVLISAKLDNHRVDLFERPTIENVATMEFYKYKRVYETALEFVPEFKKKLEELI